MGGASIYQDLISNQVSFSLICSYSIASSTGSRNLLDDSMVIDERKASLGECLKASFKKIKIITRVHVERICHLTKLRPGSDSELFMSQT